MNWEGTKHAINSTLGREDFKPVDQMIQEVKADVENLATRGMVKSVQRGHIDPVPNAAGSAGANKIIPIAEVNLNKSILIAHYASDFGGGHTDVQSTNVNMASKWPLAYLKSETEIVITPRATNSGGLGAYMYPSVAWQVVEFY